jgi:hypothetical protein
MNKPNIRGNRNRVARKLEQKPTNPANNELFFVHGKEGELLVRLKKKLRTLRARASQQIEKS